MLSESQSSTKFKYVTPQRTPPPREKFFGVFISTSLPHTFNPDVAKLSAGRDTLFYPYLISTYLFYLYLTVSLVITGLKGYWVER